MELNVEKPGQSVAKVSFTVPAAEFEKEFQRGLKQAGRSLRLKGFRPGKIPPRVVEKHHGEQVRHEVRQHFIRQAYQKAVEDEGLKPMAHPRVNLDDLASEETGDFKLEFEVNLRPEVDLPDYEGVRIESELEPVLAEEVNGAIEDVKRQQSHPEPAGDEGIDEQGMVLCDVMFLHGETTVFEREGIRLSPLTPPPGIDPEEFKEALVGAKDGGTIIIEATLPDTLEQEELRGQPGTCQIDVKEAFKMVPPTDEDLFKLLEAESEQDMKEKVREKLEEMKRGREEARIETTLVERIVSETHLELPPGLVDEQTEARLKNMHDQLAESGLPHDKIHEQLEEQRETARQEAERGLRALLIIETIGEKEKLLVTNEELEAELIQIAERNQANVDEVRKYYTENNLGQQMAVEVLERKVRRFLREKAIIQDPA